MAEDEESTIPMSLKGLRACLRCSLIKTLDLFEKHGCDNCEFLRYRESPHQIKECTTTHFEGTIAILEPQDSWVARWQRIAHFKPGLYAIEVVGALPGWAIEICDNREIEYRPNAANKK